MNDKKDDSEGRYSPGDDTASLLESLFKDTKSSQIKVVRRRIRPKSGVKKRIISKQRIDKAEEPSRTPSQRQGRPSPSKKSIGATRSKIPSRKTPLPVSEVTKESKTEQSRQRLRYRSAAGAKPSSQPSKSDRKKIAKPIDPKREKHPSKTIAGPAEERTESLDQSVINSMISMASGIKGSRKSSHPELSPGDRKKTSEADDLRTGTPTDIEGNAGTDEEITEVLEKATLDSMISELEGSGKEEAFSDIKEITGADEEITEVLEKATLDSMISELERSGKEETSSDIEEITGADEEITEVLEKATLDSMIAELEGSGKEEDVKASADESPVPEEEEDTAEIFFDSDEPRVVDPVEIEGTTGVDEEITEVLEKSALNTMISALEGNGKEGDVKASADESPVPEEEEDTAEIFFDSDEPRVVDPSEIEGTTGMDEEITEVLEKSALNTMIPALEGSGKEGEDRASIEESSVSEEEEAGVGTVVDSDDLKEKISADTDGIHEAKEEDTPSQEKSAAPSSINIEDSLLEAGAHETYPESTLKEKSIVEDRKEVVEDAPQTVDLEGEQPLESANDDLTKEEPPSQEKPAAPSSITIEDSFFEASAHEAQPESTLEEKSIVEDRKEVVEEASQPVDLEGEQPLESAYDDLTKKEPLSQEKPATSTPIPSKILGPEADVFEVHHILEDKEESILEEDKEGIERASEAVGLEIESLSDASGPAKEEPRFQEILMPSLMSSEDSKVNTREEEPHRPTAEEEPVPKGEDIIEKVSEFARSEREEPADLEEDIALTEEELQLIESSGRRSKVIRIGLPLILFCILAVVFIIRY